MNTPPDFKNTKLMTCLTCTLNFCGKFFVPSYPKGRGGSTGYGNTVALLAGGRGDEEVLSKENVKNTAASVEERSC
ncbi:unnamed protein product [Brassica rapa]|uniref:33 kDa subunit of oxygen evolving system of photosystem II n=1 Tax=Brassica campestris TaxID=3711 RepID=A0A8D9CXG5_BRACM|nr:unnamed protein product [Brassica rapa]